jgi:lipopolysaccharide transport system ATP-binding protein
MAEEEFVINVKNVSKVYKLFGSKTKRMQEALHPFKKKYHKEFHALSNINLQVRRGEILGIVGMNGSGKSTLLKIIAGIIQPTTGTVRVKGNVVPLLELGAGFNPEFSGMENIYFYNSILGFSRKKTDAIVQKIIDFAEIGDFIYQPIKTYSSGMKARLAFAVSVNIDPDILIVDEVLSVGDDLFRRKSFARIEEFFKAGKTILFVSHSESNINQLCSRAIMLHQGRIVLTGTTKIVTMNYTRFLFSNPGKRAQLLEDFKHPAMQENLQQKKNAKDEKRVDRETRMNHNQKTAEIPFFIPNFRPKSTIITCNANLETSDFCIKTTAGKEVNALVQHQEYIFSYKVTFFEEAGFLNFGFSIKTEKSVPVSWKVFPGRSKHFSEFVYQGNAVIVNLRFKCLVMPGTYFMNASIRSVNNGEEILLFKGADIFVFRVLGGDSHDQGGIFDTGFSADIQIC